MTVDDVKNWGAFVGIFLVALVQQFALARSKATAKIVRTKLITAGVEQNDKLEAIHTLVNSNMGKQLRLVSVMARRIAELTKDTTDVEAAAQADADYNAYLIRQSNFDQQAKQQQPAEDQKNESKPTP